MENRAGAAGLASMGEFTAATSPEVIMLEVSEQPSNYERCPPLGLTYSLRDWWGCADASERGVIPQPAPGGGLQYREPTSEEAAILARSFQTIHPLGDDLLLVRSDLHGLSPARYYLDVRGWLYLHFRLYGLSDEEIPGAGGRRIERECFIVSATSRPALWVRELMGEAWQTVAIVCGPLAFAQQDLRWLGENLPEELRSFRSGGEVEFAFVGDLTREMRSAIQSLMQAKMPQEIRNTYLRAKVVELLCLTLARIRGNYEAETSAPVPVELSSRDVEAIQKARRFLLVNSPAPSLNALARQVGVNRNKLTFGFKRLFGVTVGEFDRVLRLERARSLLQANRLPICHVANIAGYADPGSFSKAFKLQYGVLPSEVRGMGSGK